MQVMPLLRQILTHANGKEHQLLRAKALECISLVGMAIGKDRFREDAHQVLQFMQTLQVSKHPVSVHACMYASVRATTSHLQSQTSG